MRPGRAARLNAQFHCGIGLLLVCLGLRAAPQATAEFDHAMLWQFARLSSPVISADGRRAALVVQQPRYERKQQSTDLWLVDVEAKLPPRRLTHSRAVEAHPAFSPNGRWLAFTAKRDGDPQPQIYLLDLQGGGEAQRFTALSTGARNPQFSPDGEQLLFLSAVPTAALDDTQARAMQAEQDVEAASVRVYTGFPVRNWDRWLDDRQLRPFVQSLHGGPARDLLAGSALQRNPGYGGRLSAAGEDLEIAWAPDSQSIVIAASDNRHRSAFEAERFQLYQLPVNGGEPRLLTSLEDGSSALWGQPRFSADGRHLYALVAPRAATAYSANRLARFSWPALQRQADIELPQRLSIASYGVDGGGKSIWMTAEQRGREVLFRAPAGGGRVALAVDPGQGVYSQLQVASSSRAARMIALYDSAVAPPELVRIDPEHARHQSLTAFSAAAAADLALPPLEHFEFAGPNGRTIHNMLVRPPGFDPSRRYPLFTLIHGGPHNMWRDSFSTRWNYHLIARSGVLVLLTNYSGSTGFGEAFAQSIHLDPLQGPAAEINQAVDEAVRRYPFIDGERVCAGGASYGGHLANWLQGTSRRYRCLVSHAGLVNLESQWGSSDVIYHRELGAGGPVWERGPVWTSQNPLLHAANFRTPVLVSIGERDYRVPLNNTLEYWSLLQRQQVEARLLVFPKENHWIVRGDNSRRYYQELDAWLRRWLQID